jgi:hypothetical protein
VVIYKRKQAVNSIFIAANNPPEQYCYLLPVYHNAMKCA